MDGKIELFFVNNDGDTQYARVPWWSVTAAIKGLEREGYRSVEYPQFLKAVAASKRRGAEDTEEMLLRIR